MNERPERKCRHSACSEVKVLPFRAGLCYVGWSCAGYLASLLLLLHLWSQGRRASISRLGCSSDECMLELEMESCCLWPFYAAHPKACGCLSQCPLVMSPRSPLGSLIVDVSHWIPSTAASYFVGNASSLMLVYPWIISKAISQTLTLCNLLFITCALSTVVLSGVYMQGDRSVLLLRVARSGFPTAFSTSWHLASCAGLLCI